MDQTEYREFLRKSARTKKLGWIRAGLSGIVAVSVLVLAIVRTDLPLFLVAGLFGLISWLNVELTLQSAKIFDAIEFVARSKESIMGKE